MNDRELKMACGECGVYSNDNWVSMSKKDRKYYCQKCALSKKAKHETNLVSKVNKMPNNNDEPINQEKFNKTIDALLSTPPLRQKDLQARLKKEREEKRRK